MPNRRILSLWFPRLGAERITRKFALTGQPVASTRDINAAQVIDTLNLQAQEQGLYPGQPLRDALAMCPGLFFRPGSSNDEAAFLMTLRRWAGKFSPWVSDQPPASLLIDLTGSSHLFGGEETILSIIEQDCEGFGLTVFSGIADTPGAAWALARFANQPVGLTRTGDAIDQEAPATRARATKRRNWERGGPPPAMTTPTGAARRIASPGKTRTAISDLPVKALRIPDQAVATLDRLGLRQIRDIMGIPRASLARRFGQDVVKRLDQALGLDPEPLSPARPPDHFAVRMSMPDPIGLESDIIIALDRLLDALTARLREKGRGVRSFQAEFSRTDQATERLEITLARPTDDPERIRPLVRLKVCNVDAGYGIDAIRLHAHHTEPLSPHQHKGHLTAANTASTRDPSRTAVEDLISRLGARVSLDTITRQHPSDSHIPEKTAKPMAAAWSEPVTSWPRRGLDRPLRLWPPEPVVETAQTPALPLDFTWRRQKLSTAAARGPERIAPEWWLDDPNWRSGTRDYWHITTTDGQALWLFYAHGAGMSSGWFCQGDFG